MIDEQKKLDAKREMERVARVVAQNPNRGLSEMTKLNEQFERAQRQYREASTGRNTVSPTGRQAREK